jgi:hypothetical protein
VAARHRGREGEGDRAGAHRGGRVASHGTNVPRRRVRVTSVRQVPGQVAVDSTPVLVRYAASSGATCRRACPPHGDGGLPPEQLDDLIRFLLAL